METDYERLFAIETDNARPSAFHKFAHAHPTLTIAVSFVTVALIIIIAIAVIRRLWRAEGEPFVVQGEPLEVWTSRALHCAGSNARVPNGAIIPA